MWKATSLPKRVVVGSGPCRAEAIVLSPSVVVHAEFVSGLGPDMACL
jgi:hypothetical protein